MPSRPLLLFLPRWMYILIPRDKSGDEIMRYAEVSVNSPIAQRMTFSYSIPEGLDLEPGQAVWAPFGDKILQGIVIELTLLPAVPETREIGGVIDPSPLLTSVQVNLARWISSYYLSPLFDAVALMLPPGFERKVKACLSLTLPGPEIPPGLTVEQSALLAELRQRGNATLAELGKKFGVRKTTRNAAYLIGQHLVARSYVIEKIRIKPRLLSYLVLAVERPAAQEFLDQLPPRSLKQAELLRFFLENPDTNLNVARDKSGCSPQTVKALINKGIVAVREKQVERDPLYLQNVNLSLPLSLTASQESVFREICAGLGANPSSRPAAFLLRGVTGSGKTEVYLRALQETVRRGKKGIVLVPEIAMTPQMIERFVSRFPGRVAVLHSGLSLGVQFDEWWRIKRGEFDVVIGPRSALFAPQPDLGLIILDEEHEWTYKQEVTPRYHTRQAAIKLARLSGATLVLGSATPDVESYYQALQGEYKLLELPERVTPDEGAPLPKVQVVDLKNELKEGNLSLFSRALSVAIAETLADHEQVILFLNRRGAASFVECRNCGWVIRCRRCDLPLSYHFTEEELVCHQCNYRIPVPVFCPRCRSRKIKYLGAGTEALQAEAAKAFPDARIIRWDSDVVRGRAQSHRDLFTAFKEGKADILIGTQMVAKGLDIPGVTLVGVVSADIALNLPDFRAGERTFQLLSQVAGRAGRGPGGGRVIIQTYSPDHYAIQCAAGHDYLSFYRREMLYRQTLHYPPFVRLARLVYSHSNETRCQEEAGRVARLLNEERDARGIAGLSLIGPAPAYIHRLRSKFRWQIILRAPDPSSFLADMAFPRGWTIDIDPVGLS
jgi:primosomal protein N' (replication factor Y) (superfamily II helicase)